MKFYEWVDRKKLVNPRTKRGENMPEIGKIFFVKLLCLTSLVFAQLPHEFTQITQNTEHGIAVNVEVGPDGTVFLASDLGGVTAYDYDGESLTQVARIDKQTGLRDGISLAIGADGLVYVASYYDGLFVFQYDGAEFTFVEQILDAPGSWDVDISPDGTIFLANFS